MDKKRGKLFVVITSACVSGLLFWGGPVRAQQSTEAAAPASSGLEEIIVTARKREESILKVPVIENVIPKAQIEALQVNNINDVVTLTPGLVVSHYVLSDGDFIAIRGIGSTASDPGVDTSVALSIDGMTLANGLAYESGLVDVQQIEVLKGPQDLYYGKASPGGVIAIRTADPTDKPELIAQASYEFESINPVALFIVSGPVNDTLKLRLTTQYSNSRGWFYNDGIAAPNLGGMDPTYNREPGGYDYLVRGTALWNPSSQFDARLKVNLDHSYYVQADTTELVSCPDGTAPVPPLNIPFIGPNAKCNLNRYSQVLYLNPTYFPNIANGGVPFVTNIQKYGTLALNYRPIQNLTATSTTAYYDLESESMINATHNTYAGPALSAANDFHRHDLTEELRLNSDFNSPLNFMIGGLYEDGAFEDLVTLGGNTALPVHLPPIISNTIDTVDIQTYSVFGQLRYKIIPKLELAAGLRWTDETRTQHPFNEVTGLPIVPIVPRIQSSTNAPEITLTYTPTDDMTLYGAYKKGYKSGSFSVGNAVLPTLDNSFGDEEVYGGEVGLKSRLLDNQLALNVAPYYYDYKGLQVGTVSPPVNGVIENRTVNAGKARTYGIDMDGAYRPAPIQGLQFNGAFEWNYARYLELNNVPCWGGQTIADGCNQNFNPKTGLYTAQNLSGTQMVRAPEWTFNLGFNYELPVAGDYKLVLTNNNNYSSSFPASLTCCRPNNDITQKAFAKIDFGLSLMSLDKHWQVALLGKNLFDKITAAQCGTANIANGAILGGEITGGTGRGPAGIDEASCYPEPGRLIWLQLTFRPYASRE